MGKIEPVGESDVTLVGDSRVVKNRSMQDHFLLVGVLASLM